jgi:F420-0:gamma-glutamyl ligase-like protein
VNLNELAKEICKKEGGKKSVSIAQVKETMRCLGKVLASMPLADALKLVTRLVGRGK